MSRRNRIVAIVGSWLALAGLLHCNGLTAPAPPAAAPREIQAVVTVEGLGRQALAGAPADAAPFLRSLSGDAGSAVYTPCPVTVPAIVSLMTGAPPATHQVFDAGARRLAGDQPLLAARMHELGYRTAAFVANPLLGRTLGLDRGFDVFDGSTAACFGPDRHHPQVRPAASVVDDAVQWLSSLPPGAKAFVWVHLSDLGEPRLEGAAGPPASALERLGAVDAALRRLRDALAMEPVRGRWIVAGDRGAVPSAEGDLGQGFFLDPPAITVFYAERPLGTNATAGVARPASLTDVFARIATAGGAAAGPEAPAGGGSAPARVVSVSAIPWLWCRWPATVAVEHEDAVYVHDGRWGRANGSEISPIAEGDVPADVRSAAETAAKPLAAEPPPGAHHAELQAALRAARLNVAPMPHAVPAPARAARSAFVARLQRARLQAALGDRAGAIETLAPLSRGESPQLAALLDTLMLDALQGGTADAGWDAGRAVLAHQGALPQALHWMAHVALVRGNRELAEALLHAFLDRIPGDPDALYDLACARSLAGDAAGAESWLRASVESGFNQWRLLELDPDLRTLRADPRYAELRRSFGR